MRAGLTVPDRLVTPVRGGPERVVPRRGGSRIPHRHLHRIRDTLGRIEDRNEVGALLRRTVDATVGVHGRIALVGRDLVMEVCLRPGPVPERDDHVALYPLRSWGLRSRQ